MMGFRILIVEDHELWQNALKRYISSALDEIGHPDNTIALIKDFNQAYKALNEHTWDLLVTDIGLGGSGESQQQRGRTLVRLAHKRKIPNIVVSGTPVVDKGDVCDILMQDGASDYISKPKFEGKEFIKKVQNFLQTKDVFICHASEDKPQVVEPLVDAFTQENISYWYDKAEIKWGDSITQKVNEGLSISRFMIVVLSRSFLQKDFPLNELYSVLNNEIYSTGIKILPLFINNEEKAYILHKIPLLASKAYLTWNGHTDEIVEALQARLSVKKTR
jgi:DNA-binding NarL/FixJ family response regulator